MGHRVRTVQRSHLLRVRSCIKGLLFFFKLCPAGSPSRGGDVVAYVFNISQPSLPTPFYSVLGTVSVFMALSTVFLSINSPDKSPLSHSVIPVSLLPYWSFQLYMALSTVFLSINSPDNSPLSHSVLLVLFLPYWSFQLYISL